MSMRPVQIDVVGAATSQPIPLNYMKTPFSVTVQASIVSGAISATLQYTNDDIRVEGWDASTANWFNHTDMTTVVADTIVTLIAPVSAIRFVNADTGTARFDIRSAG